MVGPGRVEMECKSFQEEDQAEEGRDRRRGQRGGGACGVGKREKSIVGVREGGAGKK